MTKEMTRLTLAATALLAAAALTGCEPAPPKGSGAPGAMPPEVSQEFNKRMGGQGGTTAPTPGGQNPGMPAGMPTGPGSAPTGR